MAGEKMDWVRHARYRMGTIWEMAVRSADRERALWALDGAFEEIARLERMMSRFLPQSPVNELTRTAGLSAVAIDEELAEVLSLAQQVAVLSDGAFDVTMGPLIELWSQAATRGVLPMSDERCAAQALVDYRAVILDPAGPTAALRNVGMSLDLGAIGKGCAVDRAVERLQAGGYTEGWVNAGGNVRFLGLWDHPVPVRAPQQPDRALLRMSVGHGAVSTSANYERGWEIGDRWYGHLLDPRTGWPASRCTSVTVLAPSAAVADALSTACFVLGPEPGRRVCQMVPDVEAFWCLQDDSQDTIVTTPGLNGALSLIRSREAASDVAFSMA